MGNIVRNGVMMSTFRHLWAQRALLALLALITLVLMPFADIHLAPEGSGIFWGIALPAIAPILFMVYGLDLLICQVWMNEFGEEGRRRYRFLTWFNLTVMLLLLLLWLPLFFSARS